MNNNIFINRKMLKQNLITNFNFLITETTLFSLKKLDKHL